VLRQNPIQEQDIAVQRQRGVLHDGLAGICRDGEQVIDCAGLAPVAVGCPCPRTARINVEVQPFVEY
jgi:hypothetical protein